jgi:hypothetical protein
VLEKVIEKVQSKGYVFQMELMVRLRRCRLVLWIEFMGKVNWEVMRLVYFLESIRRITRL